MRQPVIVGAFLEPCAAASRTLVGKSHAVNEHDGAPCWKSGRRPGHHGAVAIAHAGKATVAITSIHCHVLGDNILRVTDLEGSVTRIICPAYESPTGFCRIRRDAFAGGPLSQLLDRVAEGTLDVRSARCDLR
jgi:hypothetical protein